MTQCRYLESGLLNEVEREQVRRLRISDIEKARDQIFENTKLPYLFCLPLWSSRRQEWVMCGYKQIQRLTRILAVRTGLDKEIVALDLVVNRGRGICP